MNYGIASFEDIIELDPMASQIAQRWDEFRTDKHPMEERWQAVYEMLFSSRFERGMDYQSKAVFPKVTQMSDILRSSIKAAIIPNERFFEFQATDREDSTKMVRDNVYAYAKSKIDTRGFDPLLDDLIMDWCITGNMFATAYVHHEFQDGPSGPELVYSGPAWMRINPEDIVFDPSMPVSKSWIITRKMAHIGEIARQIEERPDMVEAAQKFETLLDNRSRVQGLSDHDYRTAFRNSVDGLAKSAKSQRDNLDQVEVLEFRGDIWDHNERKLHKGRRIVVWDRQIVAFSSVLDTRGHGIHHVAYRPRPDNSWGQGPFENMEGMQRFVNSLMNSAADNINFAATPVFEVSGDIELPEDEVIRPGDVIRSGGRSESTFNIKQFDTNAAQVAANTAFQLISLMEEMSSIPREAGGVRSPGEKTAFEVQQLGSAASRMFSEAAKRCEINVIEPLINDCIELARKYGDTLDTIRVLGEDKTVRFLQLDRQSLGRTGRLRVKGARHFAETQQKLASLAQGLPVMQALGVSNHVDDWKAAQMFSELLGIDDFGLLSKHAAIFANSERERMMQTAQAESLAVGATDIDTPESEPPQTGTL